MVMPVFSRKKKPEKLQVPVEKDDRTGSDTVIDLD
jgi:hypothetical protein